jgi:hypothetical protein
VTVRTPDKHKDYIVWFHVPTNVVVGKGERLAFNLPANRRVVLYDLVRLRDGVRVENGITAEVSCSAEDIAAARRLASMTLNWVVEMMSFACAAAFRPPAFVLALEITPGKRDRRLVQRLVYQSDAGPRRMFRKNEFGEIWKHFDALDLAVRERVTRAMSWCRKASIEDNLLDRFVNVWSGLEAINQPLKDKHKLPREKPIRQCRKCGENVVMAATDAGIEYAIMDLASADKIVFQDALKARVGLIHGHMPLPDLIAVAGRVLPDLHKALVCGIIHLVGVEPSKASGALRGTLAVSDANELVISGVAHDSAAPDIKPGLAVPHFELLNPINARTQKEGESVFDVSDFALKPVGFEVGTRITYSVEFHGLTDPSHPSPPTEVTIVAGPGPHENSGTPRDGNSARIRETQ